MNEMTEREPAQEWEALILAGARGGERDPVAAAEGVTLKAFAEVGGRAMVARVAETLRSTGAFAAVRVSLPPETDLASDCPELAAAIADGAVGRTAATADSPAGSVEAVLCALPPGRKLLVTTADHPLLDAATVRDFVGDVSRREADAACGLAPAAVVAEAFPDSNRTALRFREGDFVGCNLFALVAGEGGLAVTKFWKQVEANRKHPARMAAMLGPGTLLRYRMGRLSLEDALDTLGRKAGARLAMIELDRPTAGVDVDSVDDLARVRRVLDQADGAGK